MDAFLLHFRSFSLSISQFYLQVKYLFPMASCLSAWLLGLAWLFVYLTDYILFPFMIPGPCQLALHIIAECWWNWSYRHHQILTFWTLRFFLFSSSQITSQCCFWFKKECHIRNSWSLQGEDCFQNNRSTAVYLYTDINTSVNLFHCRFTAHSFGTVLNQLL